VVQPLPLDGAHGEGLPAPRLPRNTATRYTKFVRKLC
jgi:hypothetical protein